MNKLKNLEEEIYALNISNQQLLNLNENLNSQLKEVTYQLKSKENEYSETFVFTNNGRIQEISIAKLLISSWQLEKLLEIYQERFRNVQILDAED